MNDTARDWPVVARITSRLAGMKGRYRPLSDFSDDCVRGDRGSGSLYLVYAHDTSLSPNPRFPEEWATFVERWKGEPMTAERVASEAPRAVRRTFGRDGLRLDLRFDRGAARRLFPMLSICDFGDCQISLMTIEGPPTAEFRELENAIWGIVYEEAKRCEREAAPE